MARSKYSKYKQGHYSPINPEKYKGTWPIIYRSSWEHQFLKWIDRHPSCINWGSESAVVTYYNPVDQKNHRYFIDFTASFKTKDGTLQKYYIEIKPYKHTIKPEPSPRKKKETLLKETQLYIKNQAKWESARKFAKSKGARFLILTEKELFKDS